MILHTFPTSPFGSKVSGLLIALGIDNQVEEKYYHPFQEDAYFLKKNPLNKIPTLEDDGEVFFGSNYICEYLLEKTKKTNEFIPNRMQHIHVQSLVDDLMNVGVIMRSERSLRPEYLQSEDWYNHNYGILCGGLSYLEKKPDLYAGNLCLSHIFLASLIGYYKLRFAEPKDNIAYENLFQWFDMFLKKHPKLERALPAKHQLPLGLKRIAK